MELAEINSIIALVKNPKVSAVKNPFKNDGAETKMYRFFKGIESGTWTSDAEAAAKLYDSSPNDKRYMMLRINLADALIRNLTAFDYSPYFSHHRATSFEFQRILIGINILLSAGQNSSAIWYAKRLLKNATDYELTEIRLNCLRILKQYAMMEGNTAQWEEYGRELEMVKRLYNEELIAEDLCEKIEIHFVNSAAQKPELAPMAFEYAQYLENVTKSMTSFTLELYRYRILLYALRINGQNKRALEVCREALLFLEANTLINSKPRRIEFTSTAMSAALSLGDYETAIIWGNEILRYYRRGTHNWYINLQKMLLCAILKSDFTMAAGFYEQAVEEPGFKNLPQFFQEKWNVYHAYLSLFVKMGVFQTSDRKLKKEFSMAGLLDSIPEIIKDKKGLNIQIHILHILFYYFQNDTEQAAKQIDLFYAYSRRFLKKEEHKRTLLFLKMLRIFKKHKFNIQKAVQAAEPVLQKLSATSLQPEQLMESSEIVPYETLWKWIVQYSEVKANKKVNKKGDKVVLGEALSAKISGT